MGYVNRQSPSTSRSDEIKYKGSMNSKQSKYSSNEDDSYVIPNTRSLLSKKNKRKQNADEMDENSLILKVYQGCGTTFKLMDRAALFVGEQIHHFVTYCLDVVTKNDKFR